MNDASPRSRVRLPAIADLSLGAKFMGLTAALILLLSVTAFISLRNSAETVRDIRSLVNFAVPAYGALARTHIRSLEQALELRRTLLLAQDPTAPDEKIALHKQAFFTAQASFKQELADAERLLGEERLSTSSEKVAASLGRVGEAFQGLKALAGTYETEAGACIAVAAARSLPDARQCMLKVDGLRDQLTGLLEGVRAGMFSVLKDMAKEAEAQQVRAERATILVFALSTILGLGVAAFGAARLIRAIRSVVRGAEAVEGGNLDARIEIASRDEIGRLAASFNRMTEGLRMRDRIREMFGRYVDPRIAARLIESRELIAERGERRQVAVLFCDLAGFTALTEQVEAERLVQFLNAYFSLLAREIAATDGVIDKYIGDGVMAYWCPPYVPEEEAALRSADAALRCLGQLPALVAAARDIFAGESAIYVPRIRVGIASGPSITGSIGAEARRNYTVIGDTVNRASRIESASKLYGTAILVCDRTAEALRAQFELREIDRVLLPGIDATQALFEIVGRKGAVTPETLALGAAYEQGLAAYRRGDWAAARGHLAECLRIAPQDGPTMTMLARIEALAGTPASAGIFSGVWRIGKEDLI